VIAKWDGSYQNYRQEFMYRYVPEIKELLLFKCGYVFSTMNFILKNKENV
jgi:hypothetical protein